MKKMKKMKNNIEQLTKHILFNPSKIHLTQCQYEEILTALHNITENLIEIKEEETC